MKIISRTSSLGMRLFKLRCLPLLAIATLLGSALFAQKNQNYRLYLRNGIIEPPSNLLDGSTGPMLRKSAASGIKRLVIIQFYDIPERQSVERLRNAGIELLEYIPDNAYTATLSGEPDMVLLRSVNARSILELTPAQKIHPALNGPGFPAHAVKVPGKVDVCISYVRSVELNDVRTELRKGRFEIISESLSAYQILEVRVEQNRLEELAALAWLQYIEVKPASDGPLNDKSAVDSRANVLASALPGGRKLDGEGVVIGIGDLGNLSEHADLTGRVISYTNMPSDWHGVHIAGTAAGGGIINEKYRGYAPGAKLLMQPGGRIWAQAATYVRDYGMVVTNNAYGTGANSCSWFGVYNESSYALDRQAGELPALLNVFAGGNSGTVSSCNGLSGGFGTVQGFEAAAKNVITVGRTASTGVISPASSRGPAVDGRIKPELIAPGGVIFSTIPTDAYQSASGTSMASPTVTAGAALLFQRYRQLNGQQNPKSALVKAVLMNGATDWGLPGPDFTHGFGMMNLLRSVSMMEKGYYLSGSVANKGAAEFQVNVPAGTAVFKVMLYWHDPASSALAGGRMLVNDLNLRLIRPNGSAEIPLVPNPAAPTGAATAMVDTINNAEQITIENPASGTYTLKVAGSKIPAGSQEYFIVYDIIEKSTVLTYPIGSERLTKGDAINISWDSYGNPSSTYAVSYSLNNGASWTSINAAVPVGTNRLNWTVPDAFTATAKIRLVQNETGVVKESGTFSIMAVPVITFSPVQCATYAAVQWTAVSGATDYEVMRLQGSEMKPVAVTTGLKYTFNSLSRDTTYYFSVRPRLNGFPGRRAVAIKRKPDSGSCAGSISDNDVGIDSIISPQKAVRMLTSSSFSANQGLTIGIRNFDDQPLTRSFEAGYSIGGPEAAVHWETITSAIPAQGYLAYTFSQTAAMQGSGTYVVNFFVRLPGDVVQGNNQSTIEARQLPNPAITLPHTEDFESLPSLTLRSDRFGMENAFAYDFTSEKSIGRLRTYIEPGMAYSGNKALMLDAENWDYSPYLSTITGTYNLADYTAQDQEIQLDFRFRGGFNSTFYGEGGVYVRGKDTDPWIFASNFYEDWYLPVDKNFKLATIAVSELLRNNSQKVSTSFQVMWRQYLTFPSEIGGDIIDDIRLYTTRSDLELTRIVQPTLPVCSDYSEAFVVSVKNNGEKDVYNAPLHVTVDGDEVYKGVIQTVKAGRDTLYTFYARTNLRLAGDHVVKARMGYGYDINPGNDSIQITMSTPPTISKFPYLEDFENGQGGWQTIDPNSSWQFGRPNSAQVKGAASGENAWKTNLTGTYQSDSVAYLYSPCFDLTGITGSLRMSFSFLVDQEACNGGGCEMPFIEYSTGNGIWSRLYGIEWGNLQGQSRWRSASLYLPAYTYTRLRIAVKGNSGNATEGMAIDDIHIYGMSYEITSESSPTLRVEENARGDNWIELSQFGWLVACIQPNGQELGNISWLNYFNSDEIKDNRGQYYMGRSFLFGAPQPVFSKPVGVRLYFLESDVERLINAPDKEGVSKPASAYDLTVTKYSGINMDGNPTNNVDKGWSYFPKSAVKIAPYWNGYYIEFSTTSFSEFWLAKGFLGIGDPMPVTLAGFSAKKQITGAENRKSALLEWQTTQEKDFSHFEIEVARDKESLSKKLFSKIGEVPGSGGNAPLPRYSFTDYFPSASGASYYRLKMVDTDGSFEYSSIRAVSFDGEREWRVFPNPAKEKIFVEFDGKAGKLMRFSLSDVGGRVVFTDNVVADGTVQKKEIDLSSGVMIPGIYLLKVVSDEGEKAFKIIRK